MGTGSNQKLDYADYAAIPEDGQRYEVLDGRLHVVTPAPGTAHQHASKRLHRQLESYFEERSIGEVFDAPIDLILGPHDVLQPDLVVARPQQVSKCGIEGVPLLVVEIVSPSTREHDRVRKAARYAALGVPHLWLVDPAERRVECHRLETDGYALVTAGEASASVTAPDWPGLVIDLAPLWR
jgi:Uma2 family endonuclease